MRKFAKALFTPVPVLLLALFTFSTAVSGLNNTFKVEKGYWNLSSNWSEGHTPTSGETAVIPATSTVTISSPGWKEVHALSNHGRIIGDGQIRIKATTKITNWRGGEITGKFVTLGTPDTGIIDNDGKITGESVDIGTGKFICGGVMEGKSVQNAPGSSVTVGATTIVIKGTATVQGGNTNSKSPEHKGGDVSLFGRERIKVEAGAKILGGKAPKQTGKDGTATLSAPLLLLSKKSNIGGAGEKGDAKRKLEGKVKWVMGPTRLQEPVLIELPSSSLGPIDLEIVEGSITGAELFDVAVVLDSHVGTEPNRQYPLTVFAQLHENSLFLAIEIADLLAASAGDLVRAGAQEVYVAWNVNKDREQFTAGDGLLIFDLYEGIPLDCFYPRTLQYALDTDFGGTNDVVGAYSVTVFGLDDATLTIEMVLPINSHDPVGADPVFEPGAQIASLFALVFGDFEMTSPEIVFAIGR